jgi:hypothetical protein
MRWIQYRCVLAADFRDNHCVLLALNEAREAN